MIVAEYIAEELSRQGVKYAFGIPGGPSIPYIEAFKNHGIEFILTSNEASAGIMADVTGRITGIPGICNATFGPGATNLTTGIGGALLDRSPVIAFTSEVPDSMRGRTIQMNIDHQELFRPLTKQTFRLSPDNVTSLIPAALSLSLEEYPGPVHIGLPSDLAAKEIPTSFARKEGVKGNRAEFDKEKLKMFLGDSVRPVLAVGLTARRLGLGPEILEFLDEYPMPVLITPMAKGLIPESHPCYLGVLFHALSEKLAAIYKKADLVVGFGYDPVEFNFESWMPDVPLISFNTISIDMPDCLVSTQVTGDLKSGLELISELIERGLSWGLSDVAWIRSEIEETFLACVPGFGPVSVLNTLMDELPEETIVTSDVGSHLHLIGQFWKTRNPENLLMTNGWSSMGFGLPAAIAAQLNHPGRPVVCITGDGGFLMMLGELITARRYNLPVIVIVLADRELNLIKLKQEWKGAETVGTGLYTGDLFQADRVLGVKIIRAETGDQMKKAVRAALTCQEPLVIEALIDPSCYAQLISPQ